MGVKSRNRSSKGLVLAVSIIICSITLACGGVRKHSAESPEIILHKFFIHSIPSSYTSKLKLWINLKTGERGKTELFVYRRASGEYSFFIKDFWGKDLMAASIKNDSILVLYPQENQFIFESIDHFSKSDHWRWEATPILLLNLIDGSLFNDLGEVHFVGRVNGNPLYQARSKELMLRFTLSPSEATLESFTLFNAEEEPLAEVKWDKVRNYKGLKRPRRLEIRFANSGDKIKIGVLEEHFGLNLPDHYFQIPLPPSVERIFLD